MFVCLLSAFTKIGLRITFISVEGNRLEKEFSDMLVELLQTHAQPIADKINLLNTSVAEWVSLLIYFIYIYFWFPKKA
jgi:hypothetical protein